MSCCVLVATIFTSFIVNSNLVKIFYGCFSYDISSTEIPKPYLFRVLSYVFCPILIISFSNVIMKYHLFSYLGKYTLGIYLFHSIILKVIKKFIYHYQWYINIGIIAVLTILLIIITYKMSKHKYSQLFITPIYYFRHNKYNQ